MPLPDQAETLLTLLAPTSGLRERGEYLRTLAGDAPPSMAAFLAQDSLSPTLREALRKPDRALIERAMRWLEDRDHHLIPLHSPLFPRMLARTGSTQLALFVAGNPLAMWLPSIAVIGSRNPSHVGLDNADYFVEGLVDAGLAIVSGLAHGIDARAHEACLRFDGVPIGVLGTGLDIAYPAANRALHEQVAERGALVSEYFPGVKPERHHFPRRNQVIAGLGLATLIIEGRDRSGALGTAEAAVSAGRDVFAVPGSIHNPLYRGNHRLIRQGACLVQSAQDVLEELHFIRIRSEEDFEAIPEALRQALAEPPDGDPIEKPFDHPDYNTLWQSFDDDPTDMGLLVSRTGLTFSEVSVILVALESIGKVIRLDGRYQRVRQRTARLGAGRGK